MPKVLSWHPKSKTKINATPSEIDIWCALYILEYRKEVNFLRHMLLIYRVTRNI